MGIQQRSLRSLASWIQLSSYSGVGPATIDVRTPSWKGRQERETLVPFMRAGSDKTIIVSVVQEGINILSVIPSAVTFPPEGGTRTITLSTNAESLSAVISSVTEQFPRTEIVTMKIMDTVIDVNGTALNYGVPGDPGADGLYQVVFTISMPENTDKESVREKFVINTETINITQPATNIPYIEVDRETVVVAPSGSSVEVNISSNTKYTIRLKECKSGNAKRTLDVKPNSLTLNSDGDEQYFNVEASSEDIAWNVNLKTN